MPVEEVRVGRDRKDNQRRRAAVGQAIDLEQRDKHESQDEARNGKLIREVHSGAQTDHSVT